ncbi:2,3-dehydroadipyl-CoA hydratase [bacterium HR41]|nr:2,3-dehydroadipyl-CoA hydratase [bacterium HR41]
MALVEVVDRGAVRHLVLNRPEKRNALNGELCAALGAELERAADDDGVRVVVVRGNGGVFSSGMDVGELRELSRAPERLRAFRRRLIAWWNLLEEMPKATVAQIEGVCLGGAFELALACDLRVMAREATAGIVETRVGLIPDVGGSSRLPAVVGLGNAKELIMTGKLIDGAEAHRFGFANRVAPAAEIDATTAQLCDELLACAPLAVGRAKRVLDQVAKPALAASLELEVALQERLAASADFGEATNAFFERRAPQFRGR